MHDIYEMLQLFAEGAEGGADGGAEGATAPEAAPQKASFEQLLEDPDYRSAHEAGIQAAISRRFKAANAIAQQIKNMAPMFRLLGDRYGVQPGEDGQYDLSAISTAVMGDTALFEEYADRHGFVDAESARAAFQRDTELDGFRAEKAQRERELLAKQEQEQRDAFFNDLHQQGEALKATFPDFDLSRELKNEQFSRLISAGLSVEDAYWGAHRKELTAGAMSHAAQRAAQGVAETVMAGKMRPPEVGAGVSPAVQTSASFTKDMIDKIILRAQRGERVTF